MSDSPISIASLATPSKTVTFEYPGYEGFEVDLCHLGREELVKLRKRCVTNKMNRKTRQFEEELDEDKFIVEYCSAVIKGWRGFTYSYLEELLLVDIEEIKNPDKECVIFNADNVEFLMKNSSDFDSWVTETVGDLANFTKRKQLKYPGYLKGT